MPYAKDISLERMFRAVEIVRERLLKVTHLLDEVQILYAVIRRRLHLPESQK